MSKKKAPGINWTSMTDDDLFCEIDGYTLRVEQMDTNYWWWCVYYPDGNSIMDCQTDLNELKTQKEAKLAAEIYFLKRWEADHK